MSGLDRVRLQRCLPYLGRDRAPCCSTLLLLIPVALSLRHSALLVGQAISGVLRGNTPRWLTGLAVPEAMRLLVFLLLGAVFVSGSLSRGFQSYK